MSSKSRCHRGLGYILGTIHWLLCEKNRLDGARPKTETAVKRWWQTGFQVRDIGGLAQAVAMGLDDNRQKGVVLSYLSRGQKWLTSWTG